MTAAVAGMRGLSITVHYSAADESLSTDSFAPAPARQAPAGGDRWQELRKVASRLVCILVFIVLMLVFS